MTKPLDPPIAQRGPLRESVYLRLKQEIVDGQLQPGEHLVETKIAERLGVSRNPVREALRRLEQEQLVTASWKGMVVGSLTRESIQEVYAVRAVLEALGCRLAAQYITPAEKAQLRDVIKRSRQAVAAHDLDSLTDCDIEFHEILITASRNATLKKTINQLRDSVRRFRGVSIALPGRPEEVVRDHAEIAQAVMAGDAGHAESLVHDHICQASQRLLSSLKNNLE